VSRVRQALRAAIGHEPPYEGLPFNTMSFAGGERSVRFNLEGRDWILDRDTYTVKPAPAVSAPERARVEPQLVRRGFPTTNPDQYEVASPDGRWFAGEKDGNIVVRSSADGRIEQLTTDAVSDYGWSVSAARWSPNGQYLAALKSDTRRLHKVPLLHWLKPREEVEWVPFTKAGGPMPLVEPAVIDVLSKRVIPVRVHDTVDPETGEGGDEGYMAPIGWLPDASEAFFYRMSRDMRRLEVLGVSPVTGKTRVVLTETQPTFIKGIASNPGWRDLFTLLDDGKRFLFISERDGWDHIYLYSLDGTLIRRLTQGTWPVLEIVAVDTKGGWVYFTGHAESRLYDTHLYRVGLDGRGFQRLTEGTGTHSAQFSPNRAFFLDTHSNVDRPPTVELRSADGKLIRVVSKGNIDSLVALGWQKPEEFIVKAADGSTDLYGVLFKPFDFDPTRKYPVIEYIYGGPQTVNAPHAFTQSWVREQAFAQLGFITLVLDARGTPERGKVFQDVVYRNFGRNEIPDHAGAIKQLGAARPYMDLSRVGIYGGSWGGYMTIRALVLAPETYSAGVATYPVAEMYDHAASAIEGYMDLVERNRAGYDYGSSLRLFNNLKGNLMIMHGTSDVNATFSASMKIVDALTRANRQYELRIFPEVNHGLVPIYDYWIETTRQFFVRHLKP
jgi:dipeptidyl aminopeptidase/acylaminoacyl peptidase